MILRRNIEPTNLHRKRAPRHANHGATTKGLAKTIGLKCGASQDHLELFSRRNNAPQRAQQKVNVQTALMRLVHNNRVVAHQQWIVRKLRKNNSVGGHAHQRARICALLKTDLIAHQRSKRHAKFLRQARRRCARCNAARLRVHNFASHAATNFQQHLWQLRGLATTSFRLHHHNLIATQRRKYVLARRRNRQRLRIIQSRNTGATRGEILFTSLMWVLTHAVIVERRMGERNLLHQPHLAKHLCIRPPCTAVRQVTGHRSWCRRCKKIPSSSRSS